MFDLIESFLEEIPETELIELTRNCQPVGFYTAYNIKEQFKYCRAHNKTWAVLCMNTEPKRLELHI